MVKPTFFNNSKTIRLIILMFVFGIALVYGMKCFGFTQVMELDVKSYEKNHYNIYDSDAILSDYEVLDCWYKDAASVNNLPLASAYTYFHVKLKSNDIISVRIPTSQLKGGILTGELRGKPGEMTKDETIYESKDRYHSDFILRVKHGILYYLVSGCASFIVCAISAIVILYTSKKYHITMASTPSDDYFDYDD